MSDRIKLNLPAARLRVKETNGERYVWDGVRRKFLLLTPEERVRQRFILFLISHCNVHPATIVQEYAVALNGTAQRADIVVMGTDTRPLALVECKAPEVEIDSGVLAQAVRYNSVVGARFLMLTNGLKHYCYELAGDEYRQMDVIPRLQ